MGVGIPVWVTQFVASVALNSARNIPDGSGVLYQSDGRDLRCRYVQLC
ncbi:hypothetical protein PC116_g29885 [Phytophthora cactorum]|nr:hypothetical protein PC116_g29885 [Phytophthora cactorum]